MSNLSSRKSPAPYAKYREIMLFLISYNNTGNERFQDGGIVANNPCALAYHEAKRIWGRDAKIGVCCVIFVKSYQKKAKLDPSDVMLIRTTCYLVC